MTKGILTGDGEVLAYFESKQLKNKDSKVVAAEGSAQDLQKKHHTVVTEGKDSKQMHKQSSVANSAFLIPLISSSHLVHFELSSSCQSTGLDLVLSTAHRWGTPSLVICLRKELMAGNMV